MKKVRRFLLLAAAVFGAVLPRADAQYLYVVGFDFGPNEFVLGQLNVATCEFCPEFNIPFQNIQGIKDVVALPDGNVLVLGASGEFRIFDPPNPVSIFGANAQTFLSAGTLTPSGTVLLAGYEFVGGVASPVVHEFDVTTGLITTVGAFSTPPNILLLDIYFWNGELRGFILDNNAAPPAYQMVTIGLGVPMTFSVVTTFPTFCTAPFAAIQSGSFAGVYGGQGGSCPSTELFDLDQVDFSTDFVCNVGPQGFFYGLSAVPASYPPPPAGCVCTTDAGSTTTPNTVLCPNESLQFSVAGQNLDANDGLQFVLFTNPSDTAGSIVATSATPTFALQAPLQSGVPYFFAAVAGNLVGGVIDLNDPCLDFSNANTVVWRVAPKVTFSASSPEICPGGCVEITATFTGTAPFSLTYSTPFSGSNTITSSAATGLFQVCAPAGSSVGPLTVQAISIQDFFCVCP